MSPLRWSGQALTEFALVTPIVLAGALGAADIGTMGLEMAVAQNAATTVAGLIAVGLPEDDIRILDELTRCGCALGYVMDDPPRLVVQLTRHHTSLTSLLPDTIEVTASAVVQPEVIP